MEIKIEAIVEEVKKLKDRSYTTFCSQLINLTRQIESSTMLRGPYRLVLDSNIVMRLESLRQGKVAEGVLSTLLAFFFVKTLPFHIDIVVRPVVFYEFLRLRNVRNLRDHWQEIKSIKSLVEDSLEVTLFFDGIETYEGAEHYLEMIGRDSKKIADTLRNYKARDWRFDFMRPPSGYSGFPTNDGRLLVPPFFAAQELYEAIQLEYFHEPLARIFFTKHIERHLAEHPDNDMTIIDRFADDTDYLLTKILRVTTKGNLEGLADIDVLSICNLQTQFAHQAHGRYAPASIGMSIDENLGRALRYYSTLRLTSPQFGGTSDPEILEQHKAGLESFIEDQRRFQEGERRLVSTREKLGEFFQRLNSLGIFREP
ncbi:hypothetical protein [Quatrionicoccus australiensis]|uniref:hypothetical protein n=1 Tax=Quatrionicoccus australiensis TaxID=138118 RepID=UPI001CF8CF00|nr:hypothetical protein [Quatrionicoccus australiensis]UCV16984.1 hypothetical protein KI612_10070 [Quatrionicoccus australiensis]